MTAGADDRPLILVTLGGGGWHRQTYRILERLSADEFRFAYVYAHHSGNRSAGRLPMPHPGDRFALRYLGPTRRHALSMVTNTARFAWSFVEAVRLVRRLRPRAIFALGHSAAFPLFVVGKVMGIKCVFIESLTRANQLSIAGKIVYHLRLAHQMYVQWPALGKKYARASFAGSVL